MLLASSDLRPRYAEDVLTALASPAGSLLRFRYSRQHVAQSILADVDSIRDRPGLVVFVNPGDEHPAALPIRLVHIVDVDCVADFLVLSLRLGPYPRMLPRESLDELMEHGRAFVAGVKRANESRFTPLTTTFPALDMSPSDDASSAWITVARSLALHPTFASTLFVRVENPKYLGGSKVPFDRYGRVVLTGGKALRLEFAHLAENLPMNGNRPSVEIVSDGEIAKTTSDNVVRVGSPYDRDEFVLHLAEVVVRSQTRVKIAAADSSGLQTRVTIPFKVSPAKGRRVAQVTLSGLGGALVALPAILGKGTAVEIRAVLGGVGALVLAYATSLVKK